MMRGPSAWSVAVRKPDGVIAEVNRPVTSILLRHRWLRVPIIRGIIALGESLSIGFRALAISANYAAQEEGEDGEVETELTRGQLIFAFGIKQVLPHLDDSLPWLQASALCGGVALYLLALSAFKRRNVGSFNYPRLVAAAVLLAFVPLATRLPALASLAVVAGVSCVLIAYEVRRYAEARDRIRHGSSDRALA